MQNNFSTDIKTRRRNYYRHDVITGSGTVGHLISTPAGYQLHTQERKLRWFRRRYYRTAGHLIDAVCLQRIRGER